MATVRSPSGHQNSLPGGDSLVQTAASALTRVLILLKVGSLPCSRETTNTYTYRLLLG